MTANLDFQASVGKGGLNEFQRYSFDLESISSVGDVAVSYGKPAKSQEIASWEAVG